MPTISYGSETLCVSMMPEGIGKTLFSATYNFMKHIYTYIYMLIQGVSKKGILIV